MEVEIKSILDDFLGGNYVSVYNYKFMILWGSKVGVMYVLFKLYKKATANNKEKYAILFLVYYKCKWLDNYQI